MDSVAGRDRGTLLSTLPALPLTAAEFLALADALGERAPATVTAELADLTGRQRQHALDEAVRTLLARGVLTAGDPVRIAQAAARLVQITCRPALRTEVRWGAPGTPEQVVRIASVTDASVAALNVAAINPDGSTRYLPFATEQLLGFLEEVADLAEGGDGSWGLVSVLYRDGAGRRGGGEVAWVDVDGTLYEVPAAQVPPSADQASPTDETGDEDGGDRTPSLNEPTTRAQLLAAVAELYPGTVTDRDGTNDQVASVNV